MRGVLKWMTELAHMRRLQFAHRFAKPVDMLTLHLKLIHDVVRLVQVTFVVWLEKFGDLRPRRDYGHVMILV